MKRVMMTPRKDWRERCEAVGFGFHSVDGVYWDESVAYEFTLEQVETLEAVIEDLHERCLEAVDWLIARKQFKGFGLGDEAIALVCESWQRDDPALYGRFDFSWDGGPTPKMLEYNADTPTSLLEASVVQWHWLREVLPDADQFNSLHEKLIAQWQRWPANDIVHFTAMTDSDEDVGNTRYLMDTAYQAGRLVEFVPLQDIGFEAAGKRFVDARGGTIRQCFKLYPWEWLMSDEFAPHIRPSGLRFIEPAWKMLLSSKAILPVLHELFPLHPNILPASHAPLAGACVRKPLCAREGQNIHISGPGVMLETDGPHDDMACIYQQFAPLACFGDVYTVVGGWVIGNEPAGMGLREDTTLVTRNSSHFVPHYFR